MQLTGYKSQLSDGRVACIMFVIVLIGSAAAAQRVAPSLRGVITDELGGAIVGATVTLTDESGGKKPATTDNQGVYVFNPLTPGTYKVRAAANGFAPSEDMPVSFGAEKLNITLKVQMEAQNVTVATEGPLSLEPENNGDSIVMRGENLAELPDDPDDLAAALQALAGPSAGPNGGEILLDGFASLRLPPKSNIREIRINQNPFSAQNDRLGSRSIEVLTKPGRDRVSGEAFLSFGDESLNSRNPFAANRAPFQTRLYGGYLSGPIKRGKASFFLDFERRAIDDNAVIKASILDSALNIQPVNLAVLTPQRLTMFAPRVDYQLNQTNTLVLRYSYWHAGQQNAGVGDFSLASRAYNTAETEHTLQLTETAVINQRIINETRFQFVHHRAEQAGNNINPTIRVLDAFTGGGSPVGLSFNNQNRWELQNYTSWATGRHALKVGGRLRGVTLTDSSSQNFGGTFTFAGGFVPKLDEHDQVVHDARGDALNIFLSSLERYQRTLRLQKKQYSPADIRALGGGATQFSITGGNPQSSVRQIDLGTFIQDDWRIRPNFTLSMGLRYEIQSHLNSKFNFAPRLRFAWSPDAHGTSQPKTVIRGGVGIFYDRVGENLTLQAERFNGDTQQQFVINDPAVLDRYPAVTSIANLKAVALQQTTWRVAENLRNPYTMEWVVGTDRQLPFNLTLSLTALNLRTLHAIRARSLKSPLEGAALPMTVGTSAQPSGNGDNVYQYESSGIYNQHLLIVLLTNRLNRKVSFFARYILGKAYSNADGVNSFPADSYDLSTEYGRSSTDVRHRFLLAGTINAPFGLRFNPFIVAQSGQPFNITTGRDANGDTLFTERPALATDLTRPSVLITRFGAFDLSPTSGQEIIPRNFGNGPSFMTVNMRVSKTIGFGEGFSSKPVAAAATQRQNGPQFDEGDGQAGNHQYKLTLSVQVQNLFNHTNQGTPIGNLSSPFFGQSTGTAGGLNMGSAGSTAAGNRRIDGRLTFSF
ncbi:MAG: hypothetical protein QOH41_708 [Blastocatellia bacterium]|jgi:hypothetical protein|nr:hypothetical protein [Blastocatellia bacterium]